MSEHDIDSKIFKAISYILDLFLVYENNYYLQVYLDNSNYKTEDTQMTDYLDDNLFETDEE